MAPPIGEICGTDRTGNYKVRSSGSTRHVVLSGSRGKDYKMGDRIEYRVTRTGSHVDFSTFHMPLGDDAHDDAPIKDDKSVNIELVLYDLETDDVLMIGKWMDRPPLKTKFSIFVDKGEIFGRNYSSFIAADADQIKQIARELGLDKDRLVSTKYPDGGDDSLLRAITSGKDDPDRARLEALIRQHLH